MKNFDILQILLECEADRTRKNHEGKRALDVATSLDIQAELKILTSQGLLSLSHRITNKTDLKTLAISGLKMDECVVDTHMTNNKGDISSVAHMIFQDWRKSIESDKVAYSILWEALAVAGLNGLREALLSGHPTNQESPVAPRVLGHSNLSTGKKKSIEYSGQLVIEQTFS